MIFKDIMDPERWIQMKKRTGKKKTAKETAHQQQQQTTQPQPKKQKGKGRKKDGW